MNRDVSVHVRPETGRGSALEALVEAAAGILAADSLEGTLGRIADDALRLDLRCLEAGDEALLIAQLEASGA